MLTYPSSVTFPGPTLFPLGTPGGVGGVPGTYSFTTPVRQSVRWDDGKRRIFEQMGTVLRGITIYRQGGQWYELDTEGHDEPPYNDAEYVYLGGREYVLTVDSDEYAALLAAGYLSGAPGSLVYPWDNTYPKDTLYPYDLTGRVVLAYSSPTSYPASDLYPGKTT